MCFPFIERMIQVIRTNANFFQTVFKQFSNSFKQLLNGIPFKNGKPIKRVFAWKVISRSSLRPCLFEKIHWPFIHSKNSLAVHPFHVIRSKISISHSSVRSHPFKNFNYPFTCSRNPFWMAGPAISFIIRSLAVPFSVRTATVWNVFAREVTNSNFSFSYLIELMFFKLDVMTWFKCNCWRASLLNVSLFGLVKTMVLILHVDLISYQYFQNTLYVRSY